MTTEAPETEGRSGSIASGATFTLLAQVSTLGLGFLTSIMTSRALGASGKGEVAILLAAPAMAAVLLGLRAQHRQQLPRRYEEGHRGRVDERLACGRSGDGARGRCRGLRLPALLRARARLGELHGRPRRVVHLRTHAAQPEPRRHHDRLRPGQSFSRCSRSHRQSSASRSCSRCSSGVG